MRFSILSVSYFGCILVAIAMLFVMPMNMALAAPATPVNPGYDIPISELNKVKKKIPAKHVKETKKKKKSTAKHQESPSEISVQVVPVGQTITPLVESKRYVQGETVHQETYTASVPSKESENIRIYHSPYSFVVAGKRSVIQAVVSSKSDIQRVNCILPATEGGAVNLVKMEKVPGTRFTYTAIVPPISQEKTSLRYTIVAVDSLGSETRSQEFVTPLSLSSVMPSWQLENSGDAISVEQKDGNKPLKNYSDPVLTR